MDIIKELKKNQTILLLVPDTDYSEVIIQISRQLAAKKNVCYVTLNKTFNSLKETLDKKRVKIKHIVWVDAISRTITERPPQTEGCYFVSSPSALTELSLTIDRFLKHHFDYLLFDSVTNLLIYQDKAPVARFLSTIVNKIKATDCKAIFFALKVKEHETLVQEAGMFVDKVIDLSKSSGKSKNK
ncbi:MAG TPA: hypothetical protein VJI75_06325 [Candidatus Nanoarchaeia archaeon]|nr:hypothetical protein [Candidatus Nanoarchaeia archaeon]